MLELPFDRVIWDAQDCADYFKESRQEFLRTRRHREGFPAEIPGRDRMWRAVEVTNFALTGDFKKIPQDFPKSADQLEESAA